MTDTATPALETRTITLSVSDGTTMPAYLARPTGADSRAAVLVFQEAFGVNAHIRDVAERFARAGYIALAPALFHRTDPAFEGNYGDFSAILPHMKALTDAGLAADGRAAYDWLTAADGGRAAVVGSVGYCLGGRVSFLADAELPLRPPSRTTAAASPPIRAGCSPTCWGAPDLHAPVLLIWGGLDKHIGEDQRRAVEDALTAAGKNATHVTFSKADHGFFCDQRASYEPNAARQSWALTLEFFASFLALERRQARTPQAADWQRICVGGRDWIARQAMSLIPLSPFRAFARRKFRLAVRRRTLRRASTERRSSHHASP